MSLGLEITYTSQITLDLDAILKSLKITADQVRTISARWYVITIALKDGQILEHEFDLRRVDPGSLKRPARLAVLEDDRTLISNDNDGHILCLAPDYQPSAIRVFTEDAYEDLNLKDLAFEVNHSHDTSYNPAQIIGASIDGQFIELITHDGREWLYQSPLRDPLKCEITCLN